jgi:hypothetical protein
MKRISLFALFVFLFNLAKSQTNDQFKPGGKPFMRIFNNFHTTFSDDESASAFELTRLYLGYEYTFSENFTALATIDVADPGAGNLEMTAFVKYAYLNYHTDKLSVFFGMIPTTQFKVQEGFWGYRYIEKSFQNAYGLNSSADLGISLRYQVADFLSADIIIQNGEGYKKLESDSVLRTGLGITLHPVKKLTGRIYYDFSHRDVTLSSLALFIGYANDRFSLAAEYNKQMNHDFQERSDLYGTSFYGTLQATKKIKLLARYDKLMSNKESGTSVDWNLTNDGELYIAGVEFPVVKGIKFSPNLRGWDPAAPGESFRSSIYFNLEIKL